MTLARVVGEHEGEEESVDRECSDEDAELDTVAYTIVQSAQEQYENGETRTVFVKLYSFTPGPTAAFVSHVIRALHASIFPGGTTGMVVRHQDPLQPGSKGRLGVVVGE